MAFEMQTYALADGWVESWSVIDEDGSSQPKRWDTKTEAQSAIDEFLTDIQAEIDAGECDPEDGYDPEDYRVAPVKHP